MEKLEYMDQVINITIPNGTVAGTSVPANVKTNSAYERVETMRIIRISNANDDNYKIGLNIPSMDINVAATHNLDWRFDAATPMSDRGKVINFPARGDSFDVISTPSVTLNADVTFQLIIRLSRPARAC